MILLRLKGSMPQDEKILQEEILHFLQCHNVEIRKEAIREIDKAFKAKSSKADIMILSYENDENEYVFSLRSENWKKFLENTIESLIAQEEFELCQLAQKLINEINQ